MNKGENSNHPPVGAIIKVDPIRRLADIRKIRLLLSANPRNLCLFVMGINTNLRASDLCRITVDMVRGNDELVIREKKTGKDRRVTLNKNVRKAVRDLLRLTNLTKPDSPLFMGRRGALTTISVNALVKAWCRQIGLKGNYGSHTLRKTWGYHQRVTFGVGIPELMVCFNHSNQRQTLDYLCVQPEEIKKVYNNSL